MGLTVTCQHFSPTIYQIKQAAHAVLQSVSKVSLYWNITKNFGNPVFEMTGRHYDFPNFYLWFDHEMQLGA